MIKRRFYRLEHDDKDDASDSSVSSSDPEPEVAAEESQDDLEVQENDESCSTSSRWYESQDSSVNEVDVDSSGLPSTEDDPDIGKENQTQSQEPDESPSGTQIPDETPLGTQDLQSDILSMKESLSSDIPVCILKCNSVFKCRLCPRVVCLNEETLKAHLNSKRHARSEKLLNEGRLKIMLNDNGEIENSTESPPRLPAFPPEHRRRKNKSQQGYGSQAKRSNKKEQKAWNGQVRGSTKSLGKKRRKID